MINVFLLLNLVVLLANLALLALSLKLYTEIMKERNMSARARREDQ